MGCGEVSNPESEQSPHRGPAIIFWAVLCMKKVASLVGWCGKNTQVLIFYDKSHLHCHFLVFFELTCISFTYNSFVSFFLVNFASSKYKSFLENLFESTAHISALLGSYLFFFPPDFYYIFPF